MLYVGVDAHKKRSHITVMDEKGQIVCKGDVASSRAGLEGMLGGLERPMRAVLEASYSWGPIYDLLDELTDDVVLAHPLKVRAIADARIKTDAIDSAILAHLLRTDLIPAAHASSKETRAVKRVLRQRMFFVRLRTMVKNRIGALLAQHSVEWPDVSDHFGKAGMVWLNALKLPAPDDALLADNLAFLKEVGARITSTNGLLNRLAAGDEVVRWLRSVPGIGEFFSVLVRYEVEDIERFREAKKFAGYTGLVPSTYASGDRMIHGRLTKQGNKWLRWALVEAVVPATQHSAFFRRHYHRVKARLGAKAAKVSTARKLAEVIWAVWKEKRPYQER